ncbi:MAG: trypsin-like peptidase domain-containing protein [Elusimicrobia bacterium]|nr:trypsin-like peptidase domain-containing protein [Elusimicrobiota bacterium]
MRKARAALALLLAVAIPVRAETTTDPLWYLLSTYVLAPDARAVEAQGDGPADSKGLAALQADLLVLTDGFEGFRDEAQVKETLERLKPRMSPELRPFFKDRSSSLDAIYRTLAVTDYTWAQRFPEPPCEPLEARRKLLTSRDGLFQTEKGEASPWLLALLGPQAEGKSAEQALDQASSQAKLTGAEYEKFRARVRKLTMALASEKAIGAARSKLYCARATAFTDLAAAQRVKDTVLISAGRVVSQKPEESVFVVVWKDQRAAATLLKTKNGAVLVTDAAIVADTDHPNLFAYSGTAKPVQLTATVVRRHPELSVAVLSYSEDLARPALSIAETTPAKDELVTAVGHTMISGLWTKTAGLVTKVGEASFQTDAAISPELSGGPVLNEASQVAGMLVLRPADTEEGRWPVAIPAPVLVRWLDDPAFNFSTAPLEIIEDDGTAAVLTRARPLDLTEAGLGAWNIPNLPPPPSVPHGVCVQNCGGGSSSGSSYSSGYSGTGGEELGKALGELGAVLILKGIPALFRGISKLFRGAGKPQASAGSSSNFVPKPAPAKPEAPPKPKLPLKPTKITLSSDKDAASRGEAVILLAEVEFTGDLGNKAGFPVTFSADSNLFEFPDGATARTDDAGRAWVEMLIKVDPADQAHEDLDREVRRQDGAVVAPRSQQDVPRSTRPESKVKFAAEKHLAGLEDEEGTQDTHSPTHSPDSSIHSGPGLPHTEAGVTLPATASAPTPLSPATMLGAQLGGTGITASRSFNLSNPGVGSATGVAEDKGRFNHVSIHVQINGQSGKKARVSESDKINVTVIMGLAMLKEVELSTRFKFRNQPQNVRNFDKALGRAEAYIRTYDDDGHLSKSFDFGIKEAYRLDLEIRGRYPFRAGK